MSGIKVVGKCETVLSGYRLKELRLDVGIAWGDCGEDLRDKCVRKQLSREIGRAIDGDLRRAVKEQEDAIKEKVEKIREEFLRRVLDGGPVPGV